VLAPPVPRVTEPGSARTEPSDRAPETAAAGDPTVARVAAWSKGRRRALASACKAGRAVTAQYRSARVQFDALRARRPAFGAAVKRALDSQRWTLRHESGRRLLGLALAVEAVAVPTVYYSRDVVRRPARGIRVRGGMPERVTDVSLWRINKRAYAARGYAQQAFARCVAGQGFEHEDSRVCRQTVARLMALLEAAGGLQIVRRNPEAPEWARGSSGYVINEYWLLDEVLRKPGLVSPWMTADGVADVSALEAPWAGLRAWPPPAQPPPV